MIGISGPWLYSGVDHASTRLTRPIQNTGIAATVSSASVSAPRPKPDSPEAARSRKPVHRTPVHRKGTHCPSWSSLVLSIGGASGGGIAFRATIADVHIAPFTPA